MKIFDVNVSDMAVCSSVVYNIYNFEKAKNIYQSYLRELTTAIENTRFVTGWQITSYYEFECVPPGGGGGGNPGGQNVCPYGKCSGSPCSCCSTCQGPCKCTVCHKDPCECIREVIVRVTGQTLRTTVVKPITNTLDEFIVPTYRIYIEGTNKDGQALQTSLEAIRFGVKYDPTLKVVGYADAQICPIIAFTPTYIEGRSGAGASAWQFSSVGHFIHAGTPVGQSVGAHGCIVLCGSGQMDILNSKLLEYSNAKSESGLANSGKFRMVFEAATRPPLVRKK